MNPDGENLFSSRPISSPHIRLPPQECQKKCVKNKIELTEQGICTMDEETNFSEATQCLVPYLQIQHPIIVDQFNVCEIVKRDELPALTVRMLQYLCEQLRVVTSSESGHLQ